MKNREIERLKQIVNSHRDEVVRTVEALLITDILLISEVMEWARAFSTLVKKSYSLSKNEDHEE